MAEQYRPVVGVGHILTRPDGGILLGHRTATGEQPTWCLPGGHLESGESPLAAGLRETAEEAGLQVTHGHLIAVCVHTAGSGVTFAVHTGVDAGHCPQALEPHTIDQWHWADPHDLPRPLFPASEAVIHAWLTPHLPLPGWELHPIHTQPALRHGNGA